MIHGQRLLAALCAMLRGRGKPRLSAHLSESACPTRDGRARSLATTRHLLDPDKSEPTVARQRAPPYQGRRIGSRVPLLIRGSRGRRSCGVPSVGVSSRPALRPPLYKKRVERGVSRLMPRKRFRLQVQRGSACPSAPAPHSLYICAGGTYRKEVTDVGDVPPADDDSGVSEMARIEPHDRCTQRRIQAAE